MRDRAVILDYGSQYTQLIARRVRELGVYCEVLPYTAALTEESVRTRLCADGVRAIIMSGGPSSVYVDGAPQVSPALFGAGVPVLGICYGLQLMVHALGGRVERADAREYGTATLELVEDGGVFSRFEVGDKVPVWMSHGDRIGSLPEGFSISGVSDNTPYCAVSDPGRRLYGIQFHPEVAHTPRGADVFSGFLFDVAGMSGDWTPTAFIEEAVERVRTTVGHGRALCALSGGVDSAVAAMICHRAIGDRLACVFVDNGLLRHGEYESVMSMFRGSGLNMSGVRAGERFLARLREAGGDPEAKRKVIGHEFVSLFEEVSRVSGAEFLVQGTIYPDVIESVSHRGPSAVIKSHHNVGGLPDTMRMRLVEPIRELFKDEVRRVGLEMGMSRDFLFRHPFPGPGLAVRCLGEVTEPRLAVLRQADSIMDAEVRSAGLHGQLWQSFCVLLPVRSVGVMGDERTYEETCVLRAVTSSDGMTADWARLPYDLVSRISSRIVNEVKGVNRVVLDVTSKPPATIEWD